MSKKKSYKNNEFTPNENIEVNSNQEEKEIEIKNEELVQDKLIKEELIKEEVQYKEIYCKVLWIKKNSFAISFEHNGEDYGLSFHVKDNHILDSEKIVSFIKLKYKGDFNTPFFSCFPVYE